MDILNIVLYFVTFATPNSRSTCHCCKLVLLFWKRNAALCQMKAVLHLISIPGASFTKLTCVSDVTFGKFLLGNTYNLLQQFNSFYFWIPSLNYYGRYWTKFRQNFSWCVFFFRSKFFQKLRIFPNIAGWINPCINQII
jgi:hypothetical protein